MLFTQSSFEFEPTSYNFDFKILEMSIKGIDPKRNIAVEVKGKVSETFLKTIKELIIKTSLLPFENIDSLESVDIDAESLSRMIEFGK